VLLPINFESARGVVLGEGKPENQNHAVVFCPGEALQTIDCNQDNIVAEGLKLRNLLAELRPELREQSAVSRVNSHGGAQQQKQVALLGFREWIFSEDSGVLAEFAAATERSFGTTVQRLMYNPGETDVQSWRARLSYLPWLDLAPRLLMRCCAGTCSRS
jgi:1,3-beta-glucan synthase